MISKATQVIRSKSDTPQTIGNLMKTLIASAKRKIKFILPRFAIEFLVQLKHLGKDKPKKYQVYLNYVANKNGIEIGGPSTLFKTRLPLYQIISSLDGVNFSDTTIWEGEIQPGLNYNFIGNRKGNQFISDATDLSQIKDCTYDFILSSNCLEHIANPIKALIEWKRVIKYNGSLILILPNKTSNFDHNRSVSSFEHILKDFNNNITEQDLTHLEEILKLHDLSMDPPAGNFENFKNRSLKNFKFRALHHHVFDLNLMQSMLEYLGFVIIEKDETKTDFFILAIKNI